MTMHTAEALVNAAEDGDTETLKALLAQGAPVDGRVKGHATALMRASAAGKTDAVQVLLDAGADIEAQKDDGLTALMMAAFFGHSEVVRVLLAHGADPARFDQLGSTALTWAMSRGFTDVVKILKEAGSAPPDSAEVKLPVSTRAVAEPVSLSEQSLPETASAENAVIPDLTEQPAQAPTSPGSQSSASGPEHAPDTDTFKIDELTGEETLDDETLDGETLDGDTTSHEVETLKKHIAEPAPIPWLTAKPVAASPPESRRFKVDLQQNNSVPISGGQTQTRTTGKNFSTMLGYAALALVMGFVAVALIWYVTASRDSVDATSIASPSEPAPNAPASQSNVSSTNVGNQAASAKNASNDAADEMRGNRRANEQNETRHDVGPTDGRQNILPSDESAVLKDALNEWIAATNGRDVLKQMSFYAPVLTAFYRLRNVSIRAVRAEKERLAAQPGIINIQIGQPEITFSRDGRFANMRFHKSYLIGSGSKSRRGEVVQELIWEKIGEVWKIVSERDVQVVR